MSSQSECLDTHYRITLLLQVLSDFMFNERRKTKKNWVRAGHLNYLDSRFLWKITLQANCFLINTWGKSDSNNFHYTIHRYEWMAGKQSVFPVITATAHDAQRPTSYITINPSAHLLPFREQHYNSTHQTVIFDERSRDKRISQAITRLNSNPKSLRFMKDWNCCVFFSFPLKSFFPS